MGGFNFKVGDKVHCQPNQSNQFIVIVWIGDDDKGGR